MSKTQKRLWAGLIIMALISPLGTLLPEYLHSGEAWGEWGTDTLEKLIGYVPEGLKKYSDLWKAPVPDYNFGDKDSSMAVKGISSVASGVLGILAVALVVYLISRMAVRNEK